MIITLTAERQAALETAKEDIQAFIDARADYFIGQQAEADKRASVAVLMAKTPEQLAIAVKPFVDAAKALEPITPIKG